MNLYRGRPPRPVSKPVKINYMGGSNSRPFIPTMEAGATNMSG